MNGNCDVCGFDGLAVPAERQGVEMIYPGRGRIRLDLCVSHLALAKDPDNEIRVLPG